MIASLTRPSRSSLRLGLGQRRDPGASRAPSRTVQREILNDLRLGGPQYSELRQIWRVLLWSGLLLALFQVQAGLLTRMGPSLVRLDLVILFVTFFALRLGAIEGALAAFAAGYVADLFVQGPPGLCRFLAVGIWLGGRILATKVRLGSKVGRILFVLVGSALYQAGILGGLHLSHGMEGGPARVVWLALIPQALLAATLALPAHELLGRLERSTTPKGG